MSNKDLEKRDKENILFKDFPQLKITDEVRNDVLQHPIRYTNYDVRIRTGQFYTDEEYEQRRIKILSTPLPGESKKGPSLVKRRKK